MTSLPVQPGPIPVAPGPVPEALGTDPQHLPSARRLDRDPVSPGVEGRPSGDDRRQTLPVRPPGATAAETTRGHGFP